MNILKKDRTTKLNCILYSPKKVRLLEIYYLQFLNKKESKNIVGPTILLIYMHTLLLTVQCTRNVTTAPYSVWIYMTHKITAQIFHWGEGEEEEEI